MKAKFRKVKEQIDFEQNINKLIDKAIILAAQINVKDIKSGLDSSQGPKGAIKKVKASTAKQKRKKGQPIKPLVATGMMRRLPPIKNKSGKSTISLANQRVKIAQYHEQGAGNLPKREFFDIYTQTYRKIERMLMKKLIKLFSKL